MYNRPDEFGGSLFSLAVSVMTDLIHHEPQSFRQLNEAGLPDAFLASIKVRAPHASRMASAHDNDPGGIVCACTFSAHSRPDVDPLYCHVVPTQAPWLVYNTRGRCFSTVQQCSVSKSRCPNLLCIWCCVQAGVLPSGDAVVSIPSALVALCLNTSGLKRVRETAVLNVLIDIFTSKKTMKVLTSDTPAVLGSGVEELLR
jgi:hypothetical protein